MEPGVMLQVVIVCIGGLLLMVTATSLAKKRINEPFSLTWEAIGVVFILAGILLRPAGWNKYISSVGLILALLIVLTLLFGSFFASCMVSTLMRKTNEMAMQISLMKQQNEELAEKLEQLSETCESEHKREEVK